MKGAGCFVGTRNKAREKREKLNKEVISQSQSVKIKPGDDLCPTAI